MNTWFALDAVINLELAKLSFAIEPLCNRGTRTRGGRGGQSKAVKAAMYRESQHTHTGDGSNMRCPSGSRGKIVYAWNGDIRMKRNQGRMEPVNCALIDLPAGKFGTQTPASNDRIKLACPGLAS